MNVSEFSRDGSGHAMTFTSEGKCVVQMHRPHEGKVVVSCAIPGMDFVPKINEYAGLDALIIMDFPSGMEVKVWSEGEVLGCKVLSADGNVSDVSIDKDVRLLQEDGENVLTEDGYDLCLE